MAMELCGVEEAPRNVAVGQMLKGKTAVALVGKRQSMRSPEATLALVGKFGLDVDIDILWRKTRLLRRPWRVRPAWRGTCKRTKMPRCDGCVETKSGTKEGKTRTPCRKTQEWYFGGVATRGN